MSQKANSLTQLPKSKKSVTVSPLQELTVQQRRYTPRDAQDFVYRVSRPSFTRLIPNASKHRKAGRGLPGALARARSATSLMV
jgi:hypothetical protein